MVEGARLESVFRGNSNVGSNPTLSAILLQTSCKCIKTGEKASKTRLSET